MSYLKFLSAFLGLCFLGISFAQAAAPADLRSSIYLKDTYHLSGGALPKTLYWKSHGAVYDQFLGVEAYSNNRNGRYQCTDLVHRFLAKVYKVPTSLGIGLGHADVMLSNIYGRFGKQTFKFGLKSLKMRLLRNSSASEPPTVGSAVNFASGSYGHVAIVRDVEFLSASSVKVYLFEQHGFPKWSTGEKKPLRSVVFKKNRSGSWGAAKVQGVGTAIVWLNFYQK